jgi:arylsulfatase A-like enzyme
VVGRWILTRKALAFIDRAAARNQSALAPEPFFLLFAPPQLHRPNLSPAFFDVEHAKDDEPATSGVPVAGVTGTDRSDTILEVDVMLGALLDGLEASGQLHNTLIIFTSDNGPFPWPDLVSLNIQGIDHGVPLRGYKGQIHEGGHRVPFIAAWGSTLQSQISLAPGTRSSALFGLQDLAATFYQLLGLQRPVGQANDSKSLLPLLTGATSAAPRKHLIVQGAPISANAAKRIDRAFYSYAANGDLWKLISLSSSTDHLAGIEFTELYNLTADPGESINRLNTTATAELQEQMQAEYLELLALPQTIASFEQ